MECGTSLWFSWIAAWINLELAADVYSHLSSGTRTRDGVYWTWIRHIFRRPILTFVLKEMILDINHSVDGIIH